MDLKRRAALNVLHSPDSKQMYGENILDILINTLDLPYLEDIPYYLVELANRKGEHVPLISKINVAHLREIHEANIHQLASIATMRSDLRVLEPLLMTDEIYVSELTHDIRNLYTLMLLTEYGYIIDDSDLEISSARNDTEMSRYIIDNIPDYVWTSGVSVFHTLIRTEDDDILRRGLAKIGEPLLLRYRDISIFITISQLKILKEFGYTIPHILNDHVKNKEMFYFLVNDLHQEPNAETVIAALMANEYVLTRKLIDNEYGIILYHNWEQKETVLKLIVEKDDVNLLSEMYEFFSIIPNYINLAYLAYSVPMIELLVSYGEDIYTDTYEFIKRRNHIEVVKWIEANYPEVVPVKSVEY